MALPDSGGFRERQLILTRTSICPPRAIGGRSSLSAPGAADRLLAEAAVRPRSGLSSGSVTTEHRAGRSRRYGFGAALSRLGGFGVLVVAGAALTGCGSSLLGATSTTPTPSASTTPSSTSATTAPLNGEVAVAFPVVGCTTASAATGGSGTGGSGTGGGTGGGGTGGGGGTTSTRGWNPTILLAPIPTALVGKVEFYSDGAHTVLGPTGW